MNPLFPGKSESDELNRIFKMLGETEVLKVYFTSFLNELILIFFFSFTGTPNEKIWPGYNNLPLANKMKFVDYPVNNLRKTFNSHEMLSKEGLDLLKKFLTYDPKERISCDGALKHPYFDEEPLAIDPSMFPTWPAKSEQSGQGPKKAASPKPPSGGGAFKKINEDEVEARLGFTLNTNAAPAGFTLRF